MSRSTTTLDSAAVAKVFARAAKAYTGPTALRRRFRRSCGATSRLARELATAFDKRHALVVSDWHMACQYNIADWRRAGMSPPPGYGK